MKAYILVGGASKRMGKPKLNLPFAGSTFLDRVSAADIRTVLKEFPLTAYSTIAVGPLKKVKQPK